MGRLLVRRVVVLGAWMIPLALAGGCFIEATDGGPMPAGPCDDLQCSSDGYCLEGECFCQPGYLGDPYAARGCQLPGPESPCGTTCGLNAYCDGGECVCVDGFFGCGTGDCIAPERICDGVEDCPAGGDEDVQRCTPNAAQTWVVSDGCDDGIDVEYRLWAEQRDWVWPGPDEVFRTTGFGFEMAQTIECVGGEFVCIGARAGALVYGVDLDRSLSCEDCCFACDGGTVDFGALECGS